ncbi:MAG: hypothetical protein BWY11_00215 [Firmicutes bacterium ADurb.Bin182]|nr:MAG: hypothetical protein BWY11_00215 [Firmicutes bacterium ADurb.Bin182]
MFILESASLFAPRGIIAPNMRLIKSFLTDTFSGFLSMLSPQNVKNIETFLPMDAAAFAITKEAMALSRSPENTIMFLLLPVSETDARPPFFTVTVDTPFSVWLQTKVFPVLLHQASASMAKAGSVVVISTVSPAFALSMVLESFMTGPGH